MRSFIDDIIQQPMNREFIEIVITSPSILQGARRSRLRPTVWPGPAEILCMDGGPTYLYYTSSSTPEESSPMEQNTNTRIE